jgi:hypothetical protein
VLIEQLRLTPIGDSKDLGFKPLRITVNGRPEPLIFNAREIEDIKRLIDVVPNVSSQS